MKIRLPILCVTFLCVGLATLATSGVIGSEELPELVPPQVANDEPGPVLVSAATQLEAPPLEPQSPSEPEAQSIVVSPEPPTEEVLAAPMVLPEANCIPARVRDYRSDRRARRVLAKHGSIDTVLMVHNPAVCDCCYLVDVCVPGCCVGEPIVSKRVGLLGRGYVEYCWPCGWQIKIVFRVRGDVIVHYRG